MNLAKNILPDGLLTRPVDSSECLGGSIDQISHATVSNAALFGPRALIDIQNAGEQSILPDLRRRLFDHGFLPAQLSKEDDQSMCVPLWSPIPPY